MPAWDPTQQQSAEADTLLLADLTDLASLNAGGGLLEAPQHGGQDVNLAGYTFGAGKFTPSIQPLGTESPSRFFFWQPDGLMLGDQGTLEFWAMHPTLNWQAVAGKTLFEINTATLYMPFQFGSAGAGIAVGWDIFSRVSSVAVNKTLTIANSALDIAAGTWASVAIVWDVDDTVRVYINGVDVGGVTGFPIPRLITGAVNNDGIRFGGTDGGPSGFAISDIRISRTARTPGQTSTLKSLDGTFSFDPDTVLAAISPDLMGYVHAFPQDPVTNAVTTPTDDATAVGGFMRTDKFLSTTPIRTFAQGPSGTTSTLGASGNFYYDWQVVDRSMALLSDRGLKLWGGIDSPPQIVGGDAPPFSGAQLTSDYCWSGNLDFGLPDDLDAWADLVFDVVSHILTLPVEVMLWGTFNEPEIQGFTWEEFLPVHTVTAKAIRAADPVTPIGAPHFGDTLGFRVTETNDLIAACIADDAPLDVFVYHEYSGSIMSFVESRKVLDQCLVANGLAAGSVPLAWGEFNWNLRKLRLVSGTDDPLADYYHQRAFGASFDTAIICTGLEEGSLIHQAFYPFSQGDPGGWVNAQLYGASGEKFANYNALKGLKMVLGDERIAVDYDLPPGVHAFASRDSATGQIGLVFANHSWAARVDRDVEITLPAGANRVQQWLVDQTHSSRRDTGDPADQDLEQTADDQVTDPTITVTVPQWGSLFVTVDPGARISKLVKINGVPALLP